MTALTNSTSDGRMVGKHRKLSHTVNEPQKHPKNIAPDGLAKNRIIDDGKLKTILKNHKIHPKIIRQHKNTLENHEDQPKIVKKQNIENIVNDG